MTDIKTIQTPVKPSKSLRRHFLSLARQVVRWSGDQSLDSVRIGVTCIESGAGSSTVSFNLASALTAVVNQKILLAEAGFGTPFVNRKRGSRRDGLSELLKGEVDASEVLGSIEGNENLFCLGPGNAKDVESVELPLDRLGTIVSDQLNQFDFIVFDLPVADGLTACDSIAAQLDGVILVVDARVIDRRSITAFKNRMERMNVEVIGVVVNKAKLQG